MIDERCARGLARGAMPLLLVLALTMGMSATMAGTETPAPMAKTCTIYVSPSPILGGAELPVSVGEVAYLFLKVKDTSPSPSDDVSFILTSPTGDITSAKGSPFGRSFRGQSAPIDVKGMWNATGTWTSGSESCLAVKKVFMGLDHFNGTTVNFDQTSRRLAASITVSDYPSDSGNVNMVLLDPAGSQNNSGLTLSLGSVFATITMQYDTYLVPGQSYSVRASFYNNFIMEVNATLSIRLVTLIKVPISSSPPATAEYRPDIMRIDANVTIPRTGARSAWMNFTLSKSHTFAVGGWFPVRPGVYNVIYSLSSTMDKNVSSTIRQINIYPESLPGGRPISTASVKASSFTGVAVSAIVPSQTQSCVLLVLATSTRGVSVYHAHEVFFTMDTPDLRVASRNETFIDLEARAESKNGMYSVEFQNSSDGSNWTRICTDITQTDGWKCSWNVTGLSPGKYHINAVATDAIGITRNTRIIVEIYAPPGILERMPIPWWWLGIAAIAGIAIAGTRKLIYAANPLLLKERELRAMLVHGDLEGFRKTLIAGLGMLTDRYADIALRDSWDVTTYAQSLSARGVLTKDANRILKRSLALAFGRKVMTRHEGQEMYICYLKYKEYMKKRPRRIEDN